MGSLLKETRNFCLPLPQLTEVSFLCETKQEQDKLERDALVQDGCGQQSEQAQDVQLQDSCGQQGEQAQDNCGQQSEQAQSKQQVSITVLTDETLFSTCGVRIAFTQRGGGSSKNEYSSLNLSSAVGDLPACVSENRRCLMQAMGIESKAIQKRLIVPKQVHETDILTVKNLEDVPRNEQSVDAVMSLVKDVPVLLCFADCVPIIIVAPTGSFCVVHAGWRGALAGIAQKSLEALSKSAKVSPDECNIYIGPHIGYCCFETSSDIFQRFVQEYGEDVCTGSCSAAEQLSAELPNVKQPNASSSVCSAAEKPSVEQSSAAELPREQALNKANEQLLKPHIDLSSVVICSLLRAGANKERIKDANKCTSCNNDVYFSYRAQNAHAGRHAAFAIQRLE